MRFALGLHSVDTGVASTVAADGHDERISRRRRIADMACCACEPRLFPAMRNFSGVADLISELSIEHRKLEALASQLHRIEPELIATTLKDSAVLLESHIRKALRLIFSVSAQAFAFAQAYGRSLPEVSAKNRCLASLGSPLLAL